MIQVENIDVFNLEGAIRGMRNPMNSWNRSDSNWTLGGYAIGESDLELMQKLYKAGTEHRKYLRQIFVSMDITAPLYWWKEFDTYKVGTVANSCSTMHKIHAKEFSIDDFSHDHLNELGLRALEDIVIRLNDFRDMYNDTKDKEWWWQMIQLLPVCYNQRRTVTMNYENVMSIIAQRTGHKLDEWNELVRELRKLPEVEAIMGI